MSPSECRETIALPLSLLFSVIMSLVCRGVAIEMVSLPFLSMIWIRCPLLVTMRLTSFWGNSPPQNSWVGAWSGSFQVQPAPRISLNAFVNYDNGTSFQRSLEFNENNKANPSAVATAELGPWTRAGSQWTADFDDRTWHAGAGGTFEIAPGRASVSANYTLSVSKLDLEYAGFGVTNWDGTPFAANYQFAFQTPPTVRQESHVADVRLDVSLARNVTMLAGYAYDYYRIRDWQQEVATSQFEAVGSEFLLRDTSRSHQWGNRLFNLGSYLAPSYVAHLGYAGLRYRF